MKKRTYKPFDALTVPLEDSNLIEASAGTGKTYSIAILVLRLILEQQLSIKNILMVTFTKAAVAELEERIRLFVRTAYKASLGRPVADANVSGLVNKAIARSGGGEEGTTLVRQSLRDAVLRAANDDGLQCRPVWNLLHRQQPYRDAPHAATPIAEELADSLISVPSSPKLADRA